MTISAVFLDWFNTIIHMEPDRHEVCVRVCHDLGIEVDPLKAARGIYAADRECPEGRPVVMSDETPVEAYVRYNNIVLRECGIPEPDTKTSLRMLAALKGYAKDMGFAPYRDAYSAVRSLKARGMVVGILSNVDGSLEPYIKQVGLADSIDFSVTSSEVEGNGKPEAPIFLEALKRAGCEAGAAVHVGDEPFSDAMGASRVGISPVLLDRLGVHADILDYPRINTLDDLAGVLDSLRA